jgi:hypothetical protein
MTPGVALNDRLGAKDAATTNENEAASSAHSASVRNKLKGRFNCALQFVFAGVIADLKTIYQAATVEDAEQALAKFAELWSEKYPTIVKQWRLKWNDIITLFEFPPEIRKAIYTTNAIESVNSVIRKFTRNRKQYPNADSALTLVYLAIHEASKRWTMPIRGWKAALNHFAILFEDRLPGRGKKEAA